MHIYTVDTPNEGHFSIKDNCKLCSPYRTMHGDTILPLKDNNLLITVKLVGPKASVI